MPSRTSLGPNVKDNTMAEKRRNEGTSTESVTAMRYPTGALSVMSVQGRTC